MAMVKALIFGSIGTITETSELQRESFNAAFVEHGLDWFWTALEYRAMISGDRSSVGGGNRIADYARLQGTTMGAEQAAAVHATKTRLFQHWMDQHKMPLNPGVDALLSEAEARGIKTVFASTTARASIDAMLLATDPSLAGRFDLVMSGNDVERAKPDPEIYRTVLDRLQLDASEAIAIEDSQPSLAAACGARIATYVVPGMLWRDTHFEGAAGVLDTLLGVSLAALTAPLEQASEMI
jgi:HAD superfamily hydrolase (TIGR01509 family)